MISGSAQMDLFMCDSCLYKVNIRGAEQVHSVSNVILCDSNNNASSRV
jgi:hypothetical protein